MNAPHPTFIFAPTWIARCFTCDWREECEYEAHADIAAREHETQHNLTAARTQDSQE
jgi:hypothetical protein